MSHATISYAGQSRTDADAAAIKDIQEYLNAKGWETLMKMVADPEVTIQTFNSAMGFAGIKGYPFHAFCRKYRLADYRAWMSSDPDPVPTDAEGFTLEA
jgi:hypothetical protein